MLLEELFVKKYTELEKDAQESNDRIIELEKKVKDLEDEIKRKDEVIKEILIIEDKENPVLKLNGIIIWKKFDEKLFNDVVETFKLKVKGEE
jgi:hypothetical protein